MIHPQPRKRKREDDIHELEGQRRTPPTMTSVDTYTPVRKGLNPTSAAFLVSGSPGLDDVTAKDSFFKNPYLMAKTFSHLMDDGVGDLYNAALTCKDFLDVALDALWQELDSLLPLLDLLPALQVDEDGSIVLSGDVSKADWDRLQYYSRKVKSLIALPPTTDDLNIHPSTYIRIAQLQSSESALFPSLRHLHYNHLDDKNISLSLFLFLSPLLDSLELFNVRGFESTIVGPFFATLSSQMLSRIVLHNGQMSADTLTNSIVRFKQLRSLELSDAILMTDFVLWEVLGTLPSLANLTLKAIDPASHPAHAPENSNSQSEDPKYFDALETLSVTGSFFLIQHLLGFIHSRCLKSIDISPVITNVRFKHDHEPEDLFTPSMTIVASKWSRSLENLVIGTSSNGAALRYKISKCLMLLAVFHEMRTFHLKDWKMENMEDDVRRLVISWPELRTLRLPLRQTSISLSTLGIIVEKCPELRYLDIKLDTSTIPPFDTSNKSLRHKLEVLTVGRGLPSPTLESQIQVARHLDLIFPYLKSIEVRPNDVFWSGIRDLVKLCQDSRRLGVI